MFDIVSILHLWKDAMSFTASPTTPNMRYNGFIMIFCVLVVPVRLDLLAAFDKVDHRILLTRLSERCGIGGNASNLLGSYLSERKQSASRVCMRTFLSPHYSLTYTQPLLRILLQFIVTILRCIDPANSRQI